MIDLRLQRNVKEIARAIPGGGASSSGIRLGTIVALEPFTVTMGGSTVRIPGAPRTSGWEANVSQHVYILKDGPKILVLGPSPPF